MESPHERRAQPAVAVGTVGAAGVAVLFRCYAQGGSQVTLYIAAGFALAAALVSLGRLNEQAGRIGA